MGGSAVTKLKYAGSCPGSGKVQYPTRKDAKEGRRLMKGKGISQTGVSIYQCADCDYWHLGHLSAAVRAGRLSREERYLEPEIAPEDGRTTLSVAREVVFTRARNRCEVCGGPATDYSHRRTRSVVGEHQHCPCNGIAACRTCHTRMHDHPETARGDGLHVSRYVQRPSDVPVRLKGAWWLLTCEGTMSLTDRRAM